MGFIVRVKDNRFIKRTSHFGAFHGSVVLTFNRKEARVWTREIDAETKAHQLQFRCEKYPHDRRKLGDIGVPVVEQE